MYAVEESASDVRTAVQKLPGVIKTNGDLILQADPSYSILCLPEVDGQRETIQSVFA